MTAQSLIKVSGVPFGSKVGFCGTSTWYTMVTIWCTTVTDGSVQRAIVSEKGVPAVAPTQGANAGTG